MKSFKQHFNEARSNPELNPKVSAYDALKKYSKNPNIYISFTEISKIGVNPKSKFNTPLGIYTYPLKQVWKEYDIDSTKNMKNLPFAAENPYIWVIEAKQGEGFINDMYKDYGSDKFDSDVKKLKNLWHEVKRRHADGYIDRKHSDKSDEEKEDIRTDEFAIADETWDEMYSDALKGAKAKNAVMSFWNLTKIMANEIAIDKNNRIGNKQGMVWNWLLRQLGYTGFADKSGKGYIHQAEPMQAVFLSTNAFTVVEKVLNKNYDGSNGDGDKLTISKFSDLTSFVLNELEDDEDRVSLIEYIIFGNTMNNSVNKKVKLKAKIADMWEDASYKDFKQLYKYIEAELARYIVAEHSKEALQKINDALNQGMRDTL